MSSHSFLPVIQRLPKFSPEDIGSIIGPGKAACEKNQRLKNLPSMRKEVITKAWSSYNTYKKAEKIEGDDPKTPYVQLDKDEEGVYAKITCDSEPMLKFVQMHLNNYQNSFKKPKQKRVYSLYVSLDHSSIPKIIGRSGSTIRAVKTEAVSEMDESIDPKDLEECEKSYLKVDKFTPRDFEDFKKMVESSDRASFVGWEPESDQELVKVFVTSYAGNTGFDNFIECLSGVLNNQVNEIREKDSQFSQDKEKELEDCYGALEKSDW